MIRPHIDEIRTDTMGNLLAFKKGSGRGKRLAVMVDAHMDEVGLMVVGHHSDGTLRVDSIGGLDARILVGKRVLVGPKKLPGVIGAKPVHLMNASEREKVVEIDALRVDIGASSKDSASGKAPLGTRIAFDSRFMEVGGMARGKALDNRAGCALLIHLLQGEGYPFDLYGTFTVQEEVGLRGAQVAAHTADPDVAIVLDATFADDLPKEDDVSPVTRLGKGPAISLMDRSVIFDPRVNRLITATGDELGIPYQFKQPGVGGTNAGSIQRIRGGIPTACISVPCRYIHTPAAMLDKNDYRNALRLLKESLARLDRKALAR
jgi:endoglucanase